jgi:hypothetical protein
MTYDDDFLQLEFAGGTRRVACRTLGVDWPPPERITVMGFEMVRDSFSQITDEQRAGLTMLMRGARYIPAKGGAA